MKSPILLLMGLALCPALAAAAPATAATPVTAAVVQRGDIEQTTRVQGVIESANTPHLHAKVAAEVVAVAVDEGDAVRKDQVLARLDDEAFRLDRQAAQAAIRRLQALLDNQRRTLRRDEALVRKKLLPDARRDAAAAAVRQTEAQLAEARARLAQAEYRLAHTRIRAPIDGRVQQRAVSVGDYVNPMSPANPVLFTLVDTRHLRARLYFPERLAHALRTGQPVTLHGEGRTVTARITRLRPMLDPASRGREAVADLDDRSGWLPGQSITAEVVLARHQGVLLVPARAVVERRGGPVVYRLRDGHAEAVPVTPGLRQGGRREVRGKLQPGERIALDGAAFLADGAPVTVRAAPEAEQGGGEGP